MNKYIFLMFALMTMVTSVQATSLAEKQTVIKRTLTFSMSYGTNEPEVNYVQDFLEHRHISTANIPDDLRKAYHQYGRKTRNGVVKWKMDNNVPGHTSTFDKAAVRFIVSDENLTNIMWSIITNQTEEVAEQEFPTTTGADQNYDENPVAVDVTESVLPATVTDENQEIRRKLEIAKGTINSIISVRMETASTNESAHAARIQMENDEIRWKLDEARMMLRKQEVFTGTHNLPTSKELEPTNEEFLAEIDESIQRRKILPKKKRSKKVPQRKVWTGSGWKDIQPGDDPFIKKDRTSDKKERRGFPRIRKLFGGN